MPSFLRYQFTHSLTSAIAKVQLLITYLFQILDASYMEDTANDLSKKMQREICSEAQSELHCSMPHRVENAF